MTLLNWAILTIAYEVTATGVILTVTTNRPCHLFMRWTTQEPNRHIYPVIERGAPVDKDVRFCFALFEDNEQEEAGDTTTHTFVKEPWAHCETRWFYFFGTVGGQSSPSETPILKYHRVWTEPPPPIEITFYPGPTAVDGYAYRHQATGTWLALRNGAGTFADFLSQGISNQIWCAWGRNTYRRLIRTYILFDTSALPDLATILTAKFRFLVYYYVGSGTWPLADYCLVGCTPLSDIEIVPADYGNVLIPLLSDTLILLPDMLPNNWQEFPLNAAGLAAINKLGITKLSVRQNCYDRLNIAPRWVRWLAFGIDFWSFEKGVGFMPELVVTYQ